MVYARRRQRPSQVPREVLARIVGLLSAEEVWLFGSRARGDFRTDSDWDFLAVVPDSTPDEELDPVSVWHRLHELRSARVDVFAVRRSDFEAARNVFGTLCQIACDEGIRVHGP